MGNQPGKLTHRGKNQMNVQQSRSVDDTQHESDNFQSNRVPNEDICVTTRSVNSFSSSLEDRENAPSMIVSDASTSDLSVSQHFIRETKNNMTIVNSEGVHVGDKINCYGAVSFVNSSQTNVQINNQQNAPMHHDFGE